MMQMEQIFIRILNMSLTAGIVILPVVFLRLFLKRLPKVFSYLLWAVVLFRLLCPVSFSSAVSLLGVLEMPSTEQGQIDYIPENIGVMEQPAVVLPVPAAESAVNAVLPPAAVENSINPMQVVMFIGMCIWVSGIIIMTIYAAAAYSKLHRKLREAVKEKDNIYYASGITTPFVCGLFSPRIYLPGKLADGLSALEEREKQYILLHEQIHIKRRDYFWRFVSFLALIIHWFNPLVWFAFFLSGRDMEMSCDEAVIRKLGSEVKKEYSASLLALASGRRIVPGIPLAFGEGETGSRIKNVLRYKKPAQIALGVTFVVCVTAIIVLAANPKAGGQGADQNAGEDVMAESEAMDIYYGIVSNMEDGLRKIVTIPGHGDVEIPEAEEQEAGTEEAADAQIGELSVTQLSGGNIADGTYRVYVRSLSRSARGIDRYLVDDMEEGAEQPFLAFAEECKFYVNREMDSLRYETVSFEELADLAQEVFSYLNPSFLLTFENGLVTEAILENYYGSGISYASVPPDIWFGHTQEITGLSAEDMFTTYYTKETEVWGDVGDGEGFEHIQVYAGNIGDGESGIVLVQNAEGETLYAVSAHISRAGWNNVYLGNFGRRDGSVFIMTVHVEDRGDYGEYDYYVFRLSGNGEIRQIAGSSFTFDDRRIPYDDALLREWTENLGAYMETCGLLLSTQDGVLRTESEAEEAERYSYETLRRGQ